MRVKFFLEIRFLLQIFMHHHVGRSLFAKKLPQSFPTEIDIYLPHSLEVTIVGDTSKN